MASLQELYDAGRYRILSRDPFARGQTIRFSLKALGEQGSCAWCGQTARWIYVWDDDSRGIGNAYPAHGRMFCSAGCCNSFSL